MCMAVCVLSLKHCFLYFSAEVLVALLHASFYDVDRAKTVATKYFDTRTSTPEVFANRHVDHDDVRSALEVG